MKGGFCLKQITLGKKIKELRLEKKMTQAELAGDTITRNMLSQIENGVAQPSVTTILELAEKLDAPTEYFFSESADLDAFRKIGAIGKIRKLYATGDYGKCLSKIDALGICDDETEYLYARAAFSKGLELYRAGSLTSASEYFEKAIEHAEKTIYTDEELSLVAKRYLCAMDFIRSKETKTVPENGVCGREAAYKADLSYICALADERKFFSFAEDCSVYAEHLAVRAALKAKAEEQDADALMAKLKEILEKLTEERYAVLKYYVLCDLEQLAGRVGDYKCAYECSSARLLLAEKMNH